jgi:hypothetical protein
VELFFYLELRGALPNTPLEIKLKPKKGRKSPLLNKVGAVNGVAFSPTKPKTTSEKGEKVCWQQSLDPVARTMALVISTASAN